MNYKIVEQGTGDDLFQANLVGPGILVLEYDYPPRDILDELQAEGMDAWIEGNTLSITIPAQEGIGFVWWLIPIIVGTGLFSWYFKQAADPITKYLPYILIGGVALVLVVLVSK
jgi:hypothetical protein